VRQSWGISESPRFSDGVTLPLLDNVSEVFFEHFDLDNKIFTPNWPPLRSKTPDKLPILIRVTISLDTGAMTSRTFLGASS
jgi:hypothetical protein